MASGSKGPSRTAAAAGARAALLAVRRGHELIYVFDLTLARDLLLGHPVPVLASPVHTLPLEGGRDGVLQAASLGAARILD